VVWRVEWPTNIPQNIVSFDNPNSKITNSDLEMADMLIHYLVLEHHLVLLKHAHVAAWCDNTPTVSWTSNKLSLSRAPIASRLTQALAMRIHANEASLLISVSITGVDNTSMADLSSRTFNRNSVSANRFKISDADFFHFFADSFPL
jgi:hypothetical protein